MRENPTSLEDAAVTYAECRWWARHLEVFTAHDIADAMLADHAVGERAVKALLYHGIIEGSGDFVNSNGSGPQEIFHYVPLPAGPREHRTLPPEWHPAAGICGRESFARGQAVAGSGMSREKARHLGSLAGRTKKRTQS